MGTDDVIAAVIIIGVYGALGVAAWRMGWRRALGLLLHLPEAITDRLRDILQEANAAWATPPREMTLDRCPGPRWCSSAPPVEITSVVTGEVIDHRCPACWLPRPPAPVSAAAPVSALRLRIQELQASCTHKDVERLLNGRGETVHTLCGRCGASLPNAPEIRTTHGAR